MNINNCESVCEACRRVNSAINEHKPLDDKLDLVLSIRKDEDVKVMFLDIGRMIHDIDWAIKEMENIKRVLEVIK